MSVNSSIPMSEFANSVPSVLTAGANPLNMILVLVDTDPSIPIGTAQLFPDLEAVEDWYGPTSNQAFLASIYFAGYTIGTQLPTGLYFTQYNESAVAAYLRGETGSIAALGLTALQALSGTIILEVNGENVTSANINLASATSFSNAAALIQTGLQTQGGIFTGTATTVNDSPTLDVTAIASGTLYLGATVTGAGIPANTTITAVPSGGGTGNYTMSANATASASVPVYVTSSATCTYDSLRQAFVITSPTTGADSTIAFPTDSSLSPALSLTSSTGAVLSQGASAATPAGVMDAVVEQTQNWATFMTTWLPTLDVNLAFAAWNSAQAGLYAYIGCDDDETPTEENSDPSCFAQQADNYVGVIPVWDPTLATGAFIASIVASINFNAAGGNTNFAARVSNAAITPQVTTLTAYLNLKANGYNMYCNVASRTAKYLWLQPGQISGAWKWITPYINQIYWNSVFQNDFALLEQNTPNIPYTQDGYELIYNSLADDIQNMGAFGAWTAGQELSGSQVAEINQAVGMNIATTIESQGWYLQVQAPSTEVQEAGGSPVTTFWYATGGGVNQISMGSIAVEA